MPSEEVDKNTILNINLDLQKCSKTFFQDEHVSLNH